MKSERINQDQIRFTIDVNDLVERNLKVSELAYGSQKTQALFDDMIKEAREKFGVDFSEKSLMIEAIPLSDTTLSVTVTKVEGMAELGQLIGTNLPGLNSLQGPQFDARNGAGSAGVRDDAHGDGRGEFQPGGFFQDDPRRGGQKAGNGHQGGSFDPNRIFGFGDEQTQKGRKAEGKGAVNMQMGSMASNEPVIYEFHQMESLLQVAAATSEKLTLKNRLMYDEASGYYYLICEYKNMSPQIRHTFSMLMQYCDDWFSGSRVSLVVEEHTKKILAARALQKLGAVQRSSAE